MLERVTYAKYMHASSNPLVEPLLFVQHLFSLRLIQGQFWPYVVHGVAVFCTVVLYHVPRVIFLSDGDGPFLTIADDAHAEDLRKTMLDESTFVGTFRLNF